MKLSRWLPGVAGTARGGPCSAPRAVLPWGATRPSAPVRTGRRGFARLIFMSVTLPSVPLCGFCPNGEADVKPQAPQERRALDAQTVTG